MINSFRNEYYFLSNMYPCSVHGYNCSEAAFQAAKCANIADREQFKGIDGLEAKKLGRKVKMRPDWNEFRLEAMYKAVLCKFTENPELGEKLVATGDQMLYEGNSWGDRFWGVCDGEGENNLGKILMRVRNELSATRGHQSSTASGCAVASQPLTTVAARSSSEGVSSQNQNLIPKGETKMSKVEKILEAFADEKRLHKMVDISYDPKIQVRPMFDAGNISDDGSDLEEFASMSLTFFVGQAMFIVEVERDLDGNEFGCLKEFSGSKGKWNFETDATLSEEVAHNLCTFADICVSYDQYVVREPAEKADMYEPDVWESDKYLEREYWDEESGEYRSRLSDEVEYRDPRYYTRREDDGCYGRYDGYYAHPCLSALGF